MTTSQIILYWIVVLAYDSYTIPSVDNNFPQIEDDYIYGNCYPVISENEEKCKIKYNNLEVEILRNRTLKINKPKFNYNDLVVIINKELISKENAKVLKIKWHFKDKNILYKLEISGKEYKTIFRENELRLI